MSFILMIDDDVDLSTMLREYLCKEGFQVDLAHDGEQGLAQLQKQNYALVVLDMMMPKLDGLQVLKQIRLHSVLPVLMLTAKGNDADRIAGLELGADDYVPKPCTAREITARIRAILRRSGLNDNSSCIKFGALELWPTQQKAAWSGKALNLTGTEFSLLEMLARHGGNLVSKQELSLQGLGRPLEKFDRSIDVHMSSLRQKLGELSDGRSCIQTVFRQGYKLIQE